MSNAYEELYNKIKTLNKQWFYDKTEITSLINGKANVNHAHTDKEDAIEFITGTTTNSGNVLGGTSTKLNSLQNGTKILYKTPATIDSGVNTTYLQLTLANGTTSQNYLCDATGGFLATKEIPANTVLLLVYVTSFQSRWQIISRSNDATTNSSGLMSKTDKVKLDGLSNFSGSYDDLTDKPTIPTATSDLTNDGSDGNNAFVSTNDSRLSDARTPTSHTHTKSQITDFPTIPDVSGKEDSSNKVSSWSSTTTDIHYPSEKLVKDSLDGKIDTNLTYATATGNNDAILCKTYSDGKVHTTNEIQANWVKDLVAHTGTGGIGSTGGDAQSSINTKINNALVNLTANKEDKIYRIVGTEVSSPASNYARLHCGTLPFDSISGKIIVYVVPDISTLSASQKALIYGSYSSGGTVSTNIKKSNNEDLTIGEIRTGDELLLIMDGSYWRLIGNSSISGKANSADLATVATTGSYTDLSNKPTIPDVSGKIDTAGTGLSKSGTTLNHSNSITALTTASFKKIKYDAQGHITGTADVTASDLPSHTHSAYVNPTIADNLTTDNSAQVLSAKQGKVLNDTKADKSAVVDWDNIVFVDKTDDATGSIILNFLS